MTIIIAKVLLACWAVKCGALARQWAEKKDKQGAYIHIGLGLASGLVAAFL